MDPNESIWTYDISDPVLPYNLRLLEGMYSPADFVVAGGYAYVADSRQGFRIFDISDRFDPLQTAHILPEGIEVRAVEVHESTAFISDGFALRVFDVSTPTAPSQIGVSYGLARATALHYHDGVIYSMGENNRFVMTSVADRANPQYIGGLSSYSSFIGDYESVYMLRRDPITYTADAVVEYSISNDCDEYCLADLNSDGRLNFFDVSAFLTAYFDEDPIADLNQDGSTNFFDVAAFIQGFNAGCP